jgi:hypothetical protein
VRSFVVFKGEAPRSLARDIALACAIALAAAALAPAPSMAADEVRPEAATPRPARPNVQEVTPRRLDIEGTIPGPSSLFVLEPGSPLFPGIGSFDALLGDAWIPSLDKETLDRTIVSVIETGS